MNNEFSNVPQFVGLGIGTATLMEWQPIETAPRDGSSVLLFDGERVSYGGWIDVEAQGCEESEADLISEGWWSVDLRENAPTHWMPLPDPPVASVRE